MLIVLNRSWSSLPSPKRHKSKRDACAKPLNVPSRANISWRRVQALPAYPISWAINRKLLSISPTSGDTSPVACRLTCNKILQKCAFTDRKLRRKSVQGMRLDALAQYLMTHDDLLLPSQKAFVPRLLNTSSLARYLTHMTFSVCVQQPGASTNSSPVSPKPPPPPLGTPTKRQGSSR